MHVDTGHNFPEVIEFRDRRLERAGARLVVASVQDVDRPGPGGRGDRPTGQPQPAPDHHAARRHRGAPLRRRVRRRPARRGEGPGQGAGVQLPRRVRPVGPQEPAARAVEPLQRPPPPGRAHPGVPASATGPSSTSGSTSRDEDVEIPPIYFAHERRVFERDGMLLSESEYIELMDGEEVFERDRPLPHRRRRDLHRRGRVHGRHLRGRSSPRSPPPGSPSGAPPGPTTASARPPWKTASGRATSDHGAAALRHGRLGRRRQVHAHRPPAVRLQGDLRGPARRGRAHVQASAATSTPTWRCSPTACGPSASRASPSTSPTATSPRPGASSSSPTPRATSSTRATWSPAPPPPTWP